MSKRLRDGNTGDSVLGVLLLSVAGVVINSCDCRATLDDGLLLMWNILT